MRKAIALALLFCWPLAAQAQSPMPPALLEAIARIESGGNPLAVNVAGRPFAPTTREDAARLVAQAHAAGKSYDVGLHQVNRFWIDKFAIIPESLLDPEVNRQWATTILAAEISRHGMTWEAVGKYHSPDGERGRLYAWRVYRLYVRLAAKEGRHGD
jgi:soluble lytic murein transglycosylase-like protein